MSVSLSCPSCNTAFAIPAIPADRRAECPRCRDVFPIRGQESAVTGPEPVVPAAATYHTPPATHQSPRSLTRLAMVAGALGVVALVAVFVLNRGREKAPQDGGPRRPAGVATPPAELRGLAYLPADTNIVFAAQPGPFVAFAERDKQDAGELVARAGLPRSITNIVTDLGLTLDQIDHVAGGTHIGDGSFDPRLTLALVLRQPPADEDDFLRRLKAKKQSGGKSRYDAGLGALPFTVVRVSPTAWVFGLSLGADPAKNLDAVDRGYEPGGGQFAPELAETIATRVPPDAAAWVATGEARWSEKPGVKFVVEVLLKKPEWMPVLAQGRAGMAALSLGDEPRLRLFVKAADGEAGRRARDYFKSLATDPKATTGGEGAAASYESPTDPATAYTSVQHILGAARK